MTLTNHQQEALRLILNFVKSKDKSVFILKGYAGTGKTTMIKSLIPELHNLGRDVSLMAPTGRAAKILSDKTGLPATTIHRAIYAFDKMQAVRHDEKGVMVNTNHTKGQNIRSKGVDDLQFWFGIKRHNDEEDPSKTVYIIDESSMISSRATANEVLHFGTDILIDDFLTYAQLKLGGKVIFVGDPAQLPPVGDNKSVALEESYFEGKGIGVASYELKEILRQKGESAILQNAMMIRNLLQKDVRNSLCFNRKAGEVEDIAVEEIVNSFFEKNPTPSIGDSIILCFTNSLAKDYNDALRRRYFPGVDKIMPGDILQVVKNNYNQDLGIAIFNGEFVRVLEVSDKVEIQSASVWADSSGERKRVKISLNFRDVVLMLDDGHRIKCKIVDTLLNSRETSLTHLQSVALYINFKMRHPQLRDDEEAFKDTILHDPYFNALQVKYGYAITGHKSQGGEWKTAYVDYSGRTGLNNDSLRWAYTATTRAMDMLYGVNMPSITPMVGLKFKDISRISKPSKEAFSFADANGIDMLPSTATAAQKQKCLCIQRQLDSKDFYLQSVTCCQYDDKYLIETPSGSVTIDCYYNASGMYTRYCPQNILPENEELMRIFENESGMGFDINYVPSNDACKMLFNKMQSKCDDLDITITNVVEHLQQYYVTYYLKTSGKFSQIQFYVKGNQALSHAMPSSDLGADDEKLQNLIKALL